MAIIILEMTMPSYLKDLPPLGGGAGEASSSALLAVASLRLSGATVREHGDTSGKGAVSVDVRLMLTSRSAEHRL